MKNIIRLTVHEKKQIDPTKKKLVLFYFEHTTVTKGKTYLVPTITKFGKRNTDGTEELPKLSLKNLFCVKCLEVKNKVSYDKLPKDIFLNSLNHIKSSNTLQKHISKKYLKSRPFLTKKDIKERGVAYSILEII